MKRLLLGGLLLLLAAGCSTNSTFVYKPSAHVSGVRKLPVKLAVLSFADGPEDFTSRGGFFDRENYSFNLAKAGWG